VKNCALRITLKQNWRNFWFRSFHGPNLSFSFNQKRMQCLYRLYESSDFSLISLPYFPIPNENRQFHLVKSQLSHRYISAPVNICVFFFSCLYNLNIICHSKGVFEPDWMLPKQIAAVYYVLDLLTLGMLAIEHPIYKKDLW